VADLKSFKRPLEQFGTLFVLLFSEHAKTLYMKNRTIQYFRKLRAKKIMEHPFQADLATFLSATMELCNSRIVKNHVKDTLHELHMPYKLTA